MLEKSVSSEGKALWDNRRARCPRVGWLNETLGSILIFTDVACFVFFLKKIYVQ